LVDIVGDFFDNQVHLDVEVGFTVFGATGGFFAEDQVALGVFVGTSLVFGDQLRISAGLGTFHED
jgi:hypothetical protein